MKGGILAILVFLAALAILLVLLQFFKILAFIALLIGFGVLAGIILLVVITGILVIVAVPYYMAAKEPRLEKQGSYTLADVKGKGEEGERRE